MIYKNLVLGKFNNYDFYGYLDQIIEDIFESILSRYQIGLEMRIGSDFIVYCVNLLYYKCHKINSKCDGSHIDSTDWVKQKTSNNKPLKWWNRCFQYAATIALNFDDIKKGLQSVSNISNNYNWEGINYPSEIEDWRRFEKKSKISLNALYIKEKQIWPAYISYPANIILPQKNYRQY